MKEPDWPKNRKLTEQEKNRIIESIPGSRGEKFWRFQESGSSLCQYISRQTKIPERRVAGVIAACTRDWHQDNPSMRELILELTHREPPPKGQSWSSYLSRKIGLPERRVRAFIAGLSKTEHRLLCLEVTFESKEHKSEAQHLNALFQIYDQYGIIKVRPERATSMQKFKEKLLGASEKYVHISAHGCHTAEKGTAIYPSQDSDRKIASAQDILQWVSKRKKKHDADRPRLVVMSACNTGRYSDMAKAFWKAGYPYFIAPPHSPTWVEATLFNTMFYYHLFVVEKPPYDAYKETLKWIPDLEHSWNFFYHGDKKDD